MLVVIPNIGLQYLFQLVPAGSPPRMLIDKINLQGFVVSISIVGVVLAILSFSANMVEDWSPIKLVSSIASAVVGFYLFLLLIGLGDPSRLGLTQLSIEIVTIVWDFRFFIILELLLLGISIMRASAKFYFARKEHLVGR